jgi:ATP-dependent Lon protease
MNNEEYTKLLSELFPSKYMNNKVNMIIVEKSKKRKHDDDDDESYEPSDESSSGSSDESSDESSESEENEESESAKNEECSPYTTDNECDLCGNLVEIANDIKSKFNNNANVQKMIDSVNKEIQKSREKKIQKIKMKNYKDYETLIAIDRKTCDTNKYFKTMDVHKQEKIIKELKKIQNHHYDTPLLFRLLDLDVSEKTKMVVYYKIKSFEKMTPFSGEYHKLKYWIDTFFSIPINVNSKLPICIHDGIDKCQEYIQNCKNILNDAVYGMDDAKLQFMQLISQWINNPESIGTSIALKGPMGTGKTTLLKNGISKLLNREIAFIALGGASDGSFLEGHSYTYEGSTYGKILDILIQCKTSNPIIYFDELDKVSDCPKGDEIIGILTHLTDTTQNSEFHDKYMSEIDIDMSKCLFIFSYNEEHKVNKILRDRMYVIETSGYNTEDKIVISKEFLIPTIEKNLCLNKGDFVFNNEILKYIIDNKTAQEKGVRNLKRNLEVIFNRINLFRLLKNEDKLFNQKIIQNIVYPFHITQDIVDILVETKKNFSHVQYMYL